MGSVLYGVYIEAYNERPDPATRWVSDQTALALQAGGQETRQRVNDQKRNVSLMRDGAVVINVFEGCNGLSVFVVFVAFLFAYSGFTYSMLWFVPLGALIIHLFNIGRITGLYLIAEYRPESFYYFHKYLFTAFIYLIVFGLWAMWVWKVDRSPSTENHVESNQ